MPLLQRKFERARAGKTPDVMGEEGALYKDGPYWIKRWSSSHEQGFGISDRYIETSVVSPHWTKFQFWQNQVIHTLFPDMTLDIVASYDPRIKKEDDKTLSFSTQGGKPTTISRDVPVKGSAAQGYQDVVHGLYKETAPDFDTIRNTVGTENDVDPEVRQRYDTVWEDAEDRLLEMLGTEEFRLFQGDIREETQGPGGLEKYQLKLEAKIRELNPKSQTLALMKAGICPVHPAINFVPREPDSDSEMSPDGTFLELRIMNFPRMERYIRKLPEKERRRVEGKWNKFMVYNDASGMFDSLLMHIIMEGKCSFPNSEVETLIYHLIDALVQKSDNGKNIRRYGMAMSRIDRETRQLISRAETEEELKQVFRREIDRV